MASSPNHSFDVFINHHGPDVKKTLASHLNRSLLSHGLRVFLEHPQMRAGDNFHSEITGAIRTATVHVAIFSPGYAESEWCLNELLCLLESGAPIIPVYYHVQPSELIRWEQIMEDAGVYSKGLRKLEPLHDSITIQKWREALSLLAAQKRGLDLQESCNGDEGELVEKIVQRVMEEIKSILSVGMLGFYCSQQYGCPGGIDWSDGTYSGIRRITMTEKDNSLTSVQLAYGLEGDETLKDISIFGLLHGLEDGASIEYNLNYPEEIVTKISGYFISYKSWDVIKSLVFHTNQRKLGPCGQEQGIPFETEERGKIVGIFGSGGALLESIGVYTLQPRTSTCEEFRRSQLYGGTGGKFWNDGTYSGIRRITMAANHDNWLTSVQLHYGLEGDESLKDKYFPGLRHGVAGGARKEYNLNYPEEFVTKISGYIGRYVPWDVIISLTFHTNQGKQYGPCGLEEEGRYFETEEAGGKIVGIFGFSGDLIDSIGVYILKPRNSRDELSESD